MPNYRRARTPGGTYFLTVVTYQRQQILTEGKSLETLHGVIEEVRITYPFVIEGWVVLPDHVHCIWTLPDGDKEFSKRWGLIKAGFSKHMKPYLQRQELLTESRKRHQKGTIWQRRFWEHHIRDDEDYRKHIDYMHYNPVKHGLVKRTRDWPHSSFHDYFRQGMYPVEWGDETELKILGDFGE